MDPPAATTSASVAHASHRIPALPGCRYTSASPVATSTPFRPELPCGRGGFAPRDATNAATRSGARDRDTTKRACDGSVVAVTRMGRIRPPASTSHAPSPTTPTNVRCHAGAAMTPTVGRPFSARPIITENSPFFATNSRVPSSGSTNHAASAAAKPAYDDGSLSSATTGMPGNAFASRAQSRAFDSWSARVTGSSPSLNATSKGAA